MNQKPECPPFWCRRIDGICCPDYECDIESGIYTGPIGKIPYIDPPDDEDEEKDGQM